MGLLRGGVKPGHEGVRSSLEMFSEPYPVVAPSERRGAHESGMFRTSGKGRPLTRTDRRPASHVVADERHALVVDAPADEVAGPVADDRRGL
jgi:hypothetical protein